MLATATEKSVPAVKTPARFGQRRRRIAVSHHYLVATLSGGAYGRTLHHASPQYEDRSFHDIPYWPAADGLAWSSLTA